MAIQSHLSDVVVIGLSEEMLVLGSKHALLSISCRRNEHKCTGVTLLTRANQSFPCVCSCHGEWEVEEP